MGVEAVARLRGLRREPSGDQLEDGLRPGEHGGERVTQRSDLCPIHGPPFQCGASDPAATSTGRGAPRMLISTSSRSCAVMPA
jgi:hypothetical protein